MSEETPTPDPSEPITPETSEPQTPPPAEAAAPVAPQPVPAVDPSEFTKEQKEKKLVSGLLGILLGALGIHKFYLGYQKEGIIMLVVSVVGTVALCGVPFAAFGMGVVGLIEGILYLTKTDDEFVSTYVVGRKPWF
jgi:TM2 domain-containing membrane protein YozV